MKIKDGYVVLKVAGNNVVINTNSDDDFNGIITLNDTAYFLWQKLEIGATEESLILSLADEYEVDAQSAQRDTSLFLQKLSEADLIQS